MSKIITTDTEKGLTMETKTQQTTTAQGKPLTVNTHRILEGGDSTNETPLKDMSPTIAQNMSMDDFNRMMKLYNERVNANNVVLSAEITAKEVLAGKEIKDKETQLPKIGLDGSVMRYPDRYKITLSFKGGTLTQTVSEAMYNELNQGSTYMFKGQLGFIKEYGQDTLSPIWQSWEQVA